MFSFLRKKYVIIVSEVLIYCSPTLYTGRSFGFKPIISFQGSCIGTVFGGAFIVKYEPSEESQPRRYKNDFYLCYFRDQMQGQRFKKKTRADEKVVLIVSIL